MAQTCSVGPARIFMENLKKTSRSKDSVEQPKMALVRPKNYPNMVPIIENYMALFGRPCQAFQSIFQSIKRKAAVEMNKPGPYMAKTWLI